MELQSKEGTLHHFNNNLLVGNEAFVATKVLNVPDKLSEDTL